MKNEFNEGKQNKVNVINELKLYIKFLIEEEFHKRNVSLNVNSNNEVNNSNNSVKIENGISNVSSDNSAYLRVLEEMKELKNNQLELIKNVSTLYDLKDEIYKDFDRIKIILAHFNNQIQFLGNQVKECKNGNLSKLTDDIDLNNEIIKTINSKIENIYKKIREFEKNVPTNNDIKYMNEKIEKSIKVNNKQIEDRLYDKIRTKQKEIVEGFSNQDKKIASMDEKFKRRIKDIDEKTNEQCSSINKRINELTDSVVKLKNIDKSDDIKKLFEITKENKESITNKTNVLYGKINNVDTQAEKLNNEIIEMKKEYKQSISEMKDIQNKNKEIESSFKDITTIVIDVSDINKELKKQNDSNSMSISIIENKINSLDNNLKNYDLEKINNNVNILRKETNEMMQDYFPSYKDSIEKRFAEFDTKFSGKIGDVHKSINKYSQKVDDACQKVNQKADYLNEEFEKRASYLNKEFDKAVDYLNEKYDYLKEIFDKKVKNLKKTNVKGDDNETISNIGNDNFNKGEIKDEIKNEIISEVENAQTSYWNKINDLFQDLLKIINERHKNVSAEISSLQKKSGEISPELNKYIEGEINKLKALISATATIPIIKNDPNYVSLQTFLLEILEKHNKKFEKVWKEEFYNCVETLQKSLVK